jgi:hypothetical protein
MLSSPLHVRPLSTSSNLVARELSTELVCIHQTPVSVHVHPSTGGTLVITVLLVVGDADDAAVGLALLALAELAASLAQAGSEGLADAGVGGEVPDLKLGRRARGGERERRVGREREGKDLAL